MAIVEEIREGPCKITIHDDCYVNRTVSEIEQTVKNVSAVIHESARRKAEDKSAS